MKKKILFVNGHMNTGGIEKSLLDILRCLPPEQYEVTLLLLESVGDYEREIPKYVKTKCLHIDDAYGSFVSAMKRCFISKTWRAVIWRLFYLKAKRLRPCIIKVLMIGIKKNFDYAVAYRPGMSIEFIEHGINARYKYAWWHHGALSASEENHIMLKQASVWAKKIITVSEACADLLESTIHIPREKICVIPNMVDIRTLHQKAIEQNPYHLKNEKKWVLVSVGRIAPEKHFENVIYAAQFLLKKGIRDFEWHIVGDKWDYDKICRAIKETGLQEYVIMEGNQVNPYPYIKYSDLMVHPSYIESQGLSILEAMALGVPCVVTKSRGPCEFIRDGENGLLTEQNAQSLAEQVERMMCDHELYEKIKRNTACPAQYRVENVTEMLEKLFD